MAITRNPFTNQLEDTNRSPFSGERRGLRRALPVPPSTSSGRIFVEASRPNELAAGIGRGLAQVESTVPALVGQGAALLGLDDYAEGKLAEARRIQERGTYPRRVQSFEDINSFESLTDYVSGLVGEQIPVLGTTLAGGLAGAGTRAVAGALGRGAAVSPLGAVTTGATVPAVGMESAGIFQEAAEERTPDRSLREVALASGVGGLIAGGLEALPVVLAADRLGVGKALRQSLRAEARRSRLGNALAGVAEQAASEAATEAAQTVIERGTRNFLNENVDILGEEGSKELLEAALAGALIGGGLGGLTGALSARGTRQDEELGRVEADEELARARGEARKVRLQAAGVPSEELQDIGVDGYYGEEDQRRLTDLEIRMSKVVEPGREPLFRRVAKYQMRDASVTEDDLEIIVGMGDGRLQTALNAQLRRENPDLSGSEITALGERILASRLQELQDKYPAAAEGKVNPVVAAVTAVRTRAYGAAELDPESLSQDSPFTRMLAPDALTDAVKAMEQSGLAESVEGAAPEDAAVGTGWTTEAVERLRAVRDQIRAANEDLGPSSEAISDDEVTQQANDANDLADPDNTEIGFTFDDIADASDGELDTANLFDVDALPPAFRDAANLRLIEDPAELESIFGADTTVPELGFGEFSTNPALIDSRSGLPVTGARSLRAEYEARLQEIKNYRAGEIDALQDAGYAETDPERGRKLSQRVREIDEERRRMVDALNEWRNSEQEKAARSDAPTYQHVPFLRTVGGKSNPLIPNREIDIQILPPGKILAMRRKHEKFAAELRRTSKASPEAVESAIAADAAKVEQEIAKLAPVTRRLNVHALVKAGRNAVQRTGKKLYLTTRDGTPNYDAIAEAFAAGVSSLARLAPESAANLWQGIGSETIVFQTATGRRIRFAEISKRGIERLKERLYGAELQLGETRRLYERMRNNPDALPKLESKGRRIRKYRDNLKTTLEQLDTAGEALRQKAQEVVDQFTKSVNTLKQLGLTAEEAADFAITSWGDTRSFVVSDQKLLDSLEKQYYEALYEQASSGLAARSSQRVAQIANRMQVVRDRIRRLTHPKSAAKASYARYAYQSLRDEFLKSPTSEGSQQQNKALWREELLSKYVRLPKDMAEYLVLKDQQRDPQAIQGERGSEGILGRVELSEAENEFIQAIRKRDNRASTLVRSITDTRHKLTEAYGKEDDAAVEALSVKLDREQKELHKITYEWEAPTFTSYDASVLVRNPSNGNWEVMVAPGSRSESDRKKLGQNLAKSLPPLVTPEEVVRNEAARLEEARSEAAFGGELGSRRIDLDRQVENEKSAREYQMHLEKGIREALDKPSKADADAALRKLRFSKAAASATAQSKWDIASGAFFGDLKQLVNANLQVDPKQVASDARLVRRWAKQFGLSGEVSVVGTDEYIRHYRESLAIIGKSAAEIEELTDVLYDAMLYDADAIHLTGVGNHSYIWVSPSVASGALRVEMLAHEFGHAIAKKFIVSTEDVQALRQDWDNWIAEKYKNRANVTEFVTSKQGFEIGMRQLFSADIVGDMLATTPEVEYMTDFEEWFADNTARYLTSDKGKNSGPVAAFFLRIAEFIRKFFRIARRDGYDAADSVEQFLENLRTRPSLLADVLQRSAEAIRTMAEKYPEVTDRSAVTTSLGGTVVPHPGWELLAAELGRYASMTVASARAVQEHFNRNLSDEEQRLLRQVFYSDSITRTRIVSLLSADPKIANEVMTDPSAAAAYGYMLWTHGMVKVGPSTSNLFGRVARRFQELVGYNSTAARAAPLLAAIRHGIVRSRQAGNIPIVLPTYNTQTRFGNTAKAASGLFQWITPIMKKVFIGADDRIRGLGSPAAIALAEMLHSPTGVGGRESYLDARQRNIGRLFSLLDNVTEGWSEARAEKALADLQTKASSADADAIRAIFAEAREYVSEVNKELAAQFPSNNTPAGVQLKDRGPLYFPWVHDLDQMMNRRDEFVALLLRPEYAGKMANIARSMGINDPATAADRIVDNIIWGSGYADATITRQAGHVPYVAAMNERKLDFIQELGSPEAKEIHASFMSKDLGHIVRVYMEQLVKRVEWERRFPRWITTATEQDPVTGRTTQVTRVRYMFDNMVNEVRQELEAQALAKRGLLAMPPNTGGVSANRMRAEINAEVDAGIAAVEGYANAVQGTLGERTNQWLAGVFKLPPPPPGQVINPTLNTTMGAAMVWQNWRVLALATVTSLVDPVGIAVRSGSFTIGWKAFAEGMKSVWAGAQNPTEMAELARTIGIIEQHAAIEALQWEYGGNYLPGKLRSANSLLFRSIGLTQWTRLTRIMATAAGTQFLSKHARSNTALSSEYLSELGLTRNDIKLDADGNVLFLTPQEEMTASLLELDRNERVKQALNRFVNESILRPQAAQRPIWASDPHYALVFHLKSFMYSFQDRILRRVWTEMKRGNYSPLLLMFAYVPLMVGLDFLRDLVRYGVDGAAWKQDWDWYDYAVDGAERAGLFGIGQIFRDVEREVVQYNNTGVEAFLGPTADSLGRLDDLLLGADGGRLEALKRELPLQNLWRPMIDTYLIGDAEEDVGRAFPGASTL